MRAIQVFVSVQSDKKSPVYVRLFVWVFVVRPATVILEDDQVEMMNIQYMCGKLLLYFKQVTQNKMSLGGEEV